MRTVQKALILGTMIAAGAALASCGEPGGEGEGGYDPVARLELEAAFPEPFSFLSSVRELSDGTLLAADPLSQVLLRVNLDAGRADTLGRVGDGPGEYRQPDQVFPLPGDSTLLVDLGKGRFTVIDPQGGLHDAAPMALPSESGLPMVIFPRAVDAEGRIYHQITARLGEGPPDSTALGRYDRETGRVDTLAYLWRPETRVERSGGNVRVTTPRMLPRDDWALSPDGRLAVVRANGYRIEWHHPDGTVLLGPDTPFEAIPIGPADKEATLAEERSGGLMMMITQSSGGATRMQMSRGGGLGMEPPSADEFEWAQNFPPFRPERTRISPSGEVWVQRWLPVGGPGRVDVFDGEGVRMGWIELPPGTQVIGFGRGPDGEQAAYLVRTDEVDLKWLERYRIVPTRDG